MNIGPIPVGLLFKLAKYAYKYAPRVGSMMDTDAVVRDLGKAMVQQKQTLTQADGPLEAAGSFGTIIEIKLLTKWTTRQMNIDTAGKSDYAVLQEIVAQTKAKGSDAAADIERTSEWTQRLYANPEVQAVLQQVTTEIEKPDSVLDIKGFAQMGVQIVKNLGDNYKKFESFLAVTREAYAQEERLKEDLRKQVEEKLRKEAEAKAKGTPEAKEEPAPKAKKRGHGGPGPG